VVDGLVEQVGFGAGQDRVPPGRDFHKFMHNTFDAHLPAFL
jgi:hypothetical protein